MVMKRADIVEITPDLWEGEGTPLRGIFCLKKRQDMKMFEDKEDCFILDFDPYDPFDATNIPHSPHADNEVAVIHEKGQVACRDYPHPRHLCSKFPFGTTLHATHCPQCYCYVCDLVAPCSQWTSTFSPHCEAFDNSKWKPIRAVYRNHPSIPVTTNN